MDKLEEFLSISVSSKNIDFILANLSSIENEIQSIFNKLKECSSLEDAEPYFKILDKTQFLLAKMAFKEDITLSSGLRKFVYDFDRLDDAEQKKYLFAVIKSGGSYFADCK